MNPNFPLNDVTICQVETTRQVAAPFFAGDGWQANQQEFAMQVEGVGEFYASGGNYVEYVPWWGVDPEWITIYLNGQVLAALMHQRKIINFHASSFIYHNKGILLLGETGAGKSSLTAAFTLHGAGFLSDDFTPVLIRNGKPFIWPVYKRIKLRKNTVQQLQIGEERVREVEKVTGKFFLEMDQAKVDQFSLDIILKIETGKCQSPEFSQPESAEKFSILRSEVCSWEILSGMPETEAAYLHHLLDIVHQVKMVKIVRPEEMQIRELQRLVEEWIGTEGL